jgi:hypothetical protein
MRAAVAALVSHICEAAAPGEPRLEAEPEKQARFG